MTPRNRDRLLLAALLYTFAVSGTLALLGLIGLVRCLL